MRRGQIGKMFLYVLTLVIFVLVLLFGYKMVTSFKMRSDEILMLKFERDLQATLHSVGYGTMKIRTFDVPGGYSQFWLIDVRNAYADGQLSPACQSAVPEVQDAIEDAIDDNAFLIGPKKFHAFRLEQVSISGGCLFAPVKNNQLELRLSKG